MSASGGHRRAGEDAHRLARRRSLPSKRAPAAETPDDAQAGAGGGVGRVHGVAVHRRGGEGGLRARRDHVAREHPAGGAVERHLLGLERVEEAR